MNRRKSGKLDKRRRLRQMEAVHTLLVASIVRGSYSMIVADASSLRRGEQKHRNNLRRFSKNKTGIDKEETLSMARKGNGHGPVIHTSSTEGMPRISRFDHGTDRISPNNGDIIDALPQREAQTIQRNIQTTTPSCHHSSLYHTSMTDFVTCTNDDEYPPSWDAPPMRDTFFFASAEECCSSMFPGKGSSCGKVDVCGGENGEGDDDGAHEIWHPTENFDKCTNDPEYPAEWNDMEAKPFFDSLDACCSLFFPTSAECPFEDVNVVSDTAATTTTSTIATLQLWHPTETFDKCTNTLDYPSEWDTADVKPLFDSLQACCDTIFDGVDPCPYEDVRASQDSVTVAATSETTTTTSTISKATTTITTILAATSSSKTAASTTTASMSSSTESSEIWHPTATFDKCSNDPNYPSIWHNFDGFLFPHLGACCVHYFPLEDNCPYEDVHGGIDTTIDTMTTTTTIPAKNETTTVSTPQNQVPANSATQDCGTRLWHPDISVSYPACTNNLNFPASWLNSMMKGITMFDTSEECCDKLKSTQIAGGATNGGVCEVTVDPCCTDEGCAVVETSAPTNAPTKSPTFSPTSAPTSAPTPSPTSPPTSMPTANPTKAPTNAPTSVPTNAPTSPAVVPTTTTTTTSTTSTTTTSKLEYCDNWHPKSDYSGCTNNPNYPSLWDDPSVKHIYHFNSHLECCEGFFNTDDESSCTKLDMCKNPPPCEERKWHPTSNLSACSNSLDYPADWDHPHVSGGFLFSDPMECCNKFFKNVANCVMEDDCAEVTYDVWHPTTDYKLCTNDMDYPKSWNTMGDAYLVDTLEKCCGKFFKNKECIYVDVNPANGNSEVMATVFTTTTTTTTTTTKATTTTTTTTSTASVLWHPTITFDTCVEDSDYPPSWNDLGGFLFESQEACCEYYSFACSSDDEGGHDANAPPTSSAPTTRPTPFPTAASSATPPPTKSPTKAPIAPPTKMPTWKPTTAQPTRTPTASPTECPTYKWHHEGATSHICSNDNSYPAPWDDPTISHNFLFNAVEECCAKFFPGTFCFVVDVCGTTTIITPKPTMTPTSPPTMEPSLVPSLTPTQLPSMTPTQEPTQSPTLHPSAAPIVDICRTRKWHPMTVTDRRCTNGIDDYPPLWDTDESFRSVYFFDTSGECCAEFYSDGNGECEIVDKCRSSLTGSSNMAPQAPSTSEASPSTTVSSTTAAPGNTSATPCNERQWHPKTIFDRTCSNDDNYPPLWKADDVMREKFFLVSAQLCCTTFYSLEDCKIVDVCDR
ncbi:hypothetical protein ACHAXS_010066 [Conticribra weissflogii]